MKVLLRKNHDGQLYDENVYSAYLGFKDIAEIGFYQTIHALDDYQLRDVIVGTDVDVCWFLGIHGIVCPNLDYPEELKDFLGRKIWASTLFTITNNPDAWHVFIKPIKEARRFTGTVLNETKDLIKLGGLVDDIEVWCSTTVNFLSEWRAYVTDGEILGLYPYKGNWRIFPNPDVIDEAVKAYKSAPRGYVIDFGVDDHGRTLLVEVNDGYGLTNYGLAPDKYARLLLARWEELVADKLVSQKTEVNCQPVEKN